MFRIVLAILLLPIGTLQGAEHNETDTKDSLEKIKSDIQTLNDLIARWIKREQLPAGPIDPNADCAWKKINASIAPDGILIPSAKTIEACQDACERTTDCRYFDWVPCQQLCYLSAKPTAQRYELTCSGLTTNGLPRNTTAEQSPTQPSEPGTSTTLPTISEIEHSTTPSPPAETDPPAPETTAMLPAVRTTKSPTFATIPVCKRRLDLVFVVDGSGSICNVVSYRSPNLTCSNWDFNLQFIHKMIDRLVIGPDDTRVALVKFATTVKVEWDLKTYTNKTSLLEAVDGLLYPTGMTNTADALQVLVDRVFTPAAGDRPDVPNRAILITDGEPNTQTVPLPSAISAVHRSGIKMFVVGVTQSVNEKIIRNISSPPQKLNVTYFLAKDYSSIEVVGEELMKESCIL